MSPMNPDDDVLLPQEEAAHWMFLMLEHLADWPIKSAEAFRNALLGPNATCTVNPMLGLTKKDELDLLRGHVITAVEEGRMIDFGFLPNEMMKDESVGSRAVYEAGDLPHPYDNWVATHTWEGGFCAYYFSTLPEYPGMTLCYEMYGIAVPDALDTVLIYDIIMVEVKAVGNTVVSPAHTIIPHYDQDKKALEMRGANCLDPMVTMLGMLSNAAIPVIDHPAPEKLNRIRVKQGKFPIPAHHQVMTKDYVTTYRSGSGHAAKVSKGGHHASPIPHSRRGHMRHMKSGKIVHVRSSKVNWRDSEEMHRLFYRIKNEPGK